MFKKCFLILTLFTITSTCDAWFIGMRSRVITTGPYQQTGNPPVTWADVCSTHYPSDAPKHRKNREWTHSYHDSQKVTDTPRIFGDAISDGDRVYIVIKQY